MDKLPGLGQNNTTYDGEMCVGAYTVRVHAPTCNLFIIWAPECAYTLTRVRLEVCPCVCTQWALIKGLYWGDVGALSLSFPSDKTEC